MADKVWGGDATLWRADSATPGETNFTKILSVTELAETGGETQMVDTTNRDDLAVSPQLVQTAGNFAPISVDYSIQFDMDDATHVALITQAEAREARDYQIRITGVTNRVKFRGIQKAIPKSYDTNNVVIGRTGIVCTTRLSYAP